MTIAMNRAQTAARSAASSSPLILLGAAILLVAALLSWPISVPIGPMYWDVIIYYDAANRIFDGQAPILDFFTPVGPLGYYLFAGWLWLFPNGQPVLLSHWSLLAVTAPMIAVVVSDIDRRARTTAFAILIPFLFFALLPFNTREFYPFPGSDGFGIYNRQCCQVLYVLVAAVVFVRDQRKLGAIVVMSMLALFFLKITGVIAALLICAFAFMTGRLYLRTAIVAGIAFFAVLGFTEWRWSLITVYITDILSLVEKNSDTLAPRFLQAASTTFGVVAPALALSALSLYGGRRRLTESLTAFRSAPSFGNAARIIDHDGLWLGVVLAAGIFFETQNTGSQAMIFLWPVVLAILLRSGKLLGSPRLLVATLALAAAAMLPIAVNTGERAARTYIGSIKDDVLASTNLKTLGNVSMRGIVRERSKDMLEYYPRVQVPLADLVKAGELPTPVLYSDFDFQVVHLIAIDRAITEIHAIEASRGIRFETIMALNFVNAFPWLMDRSAPRHIAIGADPSRAVPRPDAAVKEAVEATDLVLYPKCPLTTANADLYALYAPMLAKHRRISLDACYDAFVNPRFADKLAGL